jgi:cleavage and polyadenylation specificity factor subunit 1
MPIFSQESPFKLDVIAKDLYDASIVSVDFLASEGAITFGAVDDRGDLRLLQFDAQRELRLPRLITLTNSYWDVEVSSNEVAKLVRRTEYHMGPTPVKSVMVARRKTAEDRVAPQTTVVYGVCFLRGRDNNAEHRP